jgi:hypothetical protein
MKRLSKKMTSILALAVGVGIASPPIQAQQASDLAGTGIYTSRIESATSNTIENSTSLPTNALGGSAAERIPPSVSEAADAPAKSIAGSLGQAGWIAGNGSFGARQQAEWTPGNGYFKASGQSDWIAGKSSFGLARQSGGILHVNSIARPSKAPGISSPTSILGIGSPSVSAFSTPRTSYKIPVAAPGGLAATGNRQPQLSHRSSFGTAGWGSRGIHGRFGLSEGAIGAGTLNSVRGDSLGGKAIGTLAGAGSQSGTTTQSTNPSPFQ